MWLSLQGAALRGWHFVWSVIRVRLICVTGWKIFFGATAIFVGLIAILVGATGRFVSLFERTKFKAAG